MSTYESIVTLSCNVYRGYTTRGQESALLHSVGARFRKTTSGYRAARGTPMRARPDTYLDRPCYLLLDLGMGCSQFLEWGFCR
jgi:hypothetical protein